MGFGQPVHNDLLSTRLIPCGLEPELLKQNLERRLGYVEVEFDLLVIHLGLDRIVEFEQLRFIVGRGKASHADQPSELRV